MTIVHCAPSWTAHAQSSSSLENSTLCTKDAKCIILGKCDFAKTRTRENVTLCVRGSIYYFFVRRPENKFSRPVWKSWNSKYITLFYIVYFAASIRAAKIHFAAWGQKSQFSSLVAQCTIYYFINFSFSAIGFICTGICGIMNRWIFICFHI